PAVGDASGRPVPNSFRFPSSASTLGGRLTRQAADDTVAPLAATGNTSEGGQSTINAASSPPSTWCAPGGDLRQLAADKAVVAAPTGAITEPTLVGGPSPPLGVLDAPLKVVRELFKPRNHNTLVS